MVSDGALVLGVLHTLHIDSAISSFNLEEPHKSKAYSVI